jgi:hypothetical protein
VAAATATGDLTVITCVASSTRPVYSPTSSPVTIAYDTARLIIRSMSYRRYFKMPTPMPTGSAASPIPRTSPASPVELMPNDAASTIRVTAPPLASHFSCWRCSPVARRQLSTWWATNDSQMPRIAATMSTVAAPASPPACDPPVLITSP